LWISLKCYLHKFYLGILYYNKTEFNSDSMTKNKKHSYQIVGKYDNLDQIDAHIFRWGNGGLYKIDIIHSDSSLFYALPIHSYRGGALINSSKTHLLHGAVLIDISDKSLRALPNEQFSYIKNADFCDYICLFFNPNIPEILFRISCYNFETEKTVADRIGTFNYQTSTLKLLSPFNDERDCITPIYHPDGKKIAFLSENKAYIIYR